NDIETFCHFEFVPSLRNTSVWVAYWLQFAVRKRRERLQAVMLKDMSGAVPVQYHVYLRGNRHHEFWVYSIDEVLSPIVGLGIRHACIEELSRIDIAHQQALP